MTLKTRLELPENEGLFDAAALPGAGRGAS
jgi:hypothetical protein